MQLNKNLGINLFEFFIITFSAILLFLTGFMYENLGISIQNKKSDIYNPSESGSDRYIRFIFIGSSDCGFSNNEETLNNVASLKEIVRKKTPEEVGFISTGISTDSTAYAGIHFLNKTGPYAEIIAGGDIYNNGYMKFVWEKGVNPGTPQVIVLLEEYKYTINSKIMSDIDRSVDIIKMAQGVEEIRRFNSNLSSFSEILPDDIKTN